MVGVGNWVWRAGCLLGGNARSWAGGLETVALEKERRGSMEGIIARGRSLNDSCVVVCAVSPESR